MIRTQVQLTEYQARAVKELARKQGISMAEFIRQAVERSVAKSEEEDKWRRASALIGRFSDGPRDVAENHDKYLDEAYS